MKAGLKVLNQPCCAPGAPPLPRDDAERLVMLDEGTFECRAGVIVAHALHHGDLHREQICSILRRIGLEPPDLQPWEYAIDKGRARFVSSA